CWPSFRTARRPATRATASTRRRSRCWSAADRWPALAQCWSTIDRRLARHGATRGASDESAGGPVSYDLVVRGGTVVTATDRYAADIGVQAGQVAAIARSMPPGREEVDASGLLVLPGGVDVHTHLDAEVGGVRTADDFESGTAAAACGGITTICDYAWQARGQSLLEAVEAWKLKAAERAHVDYGFHVIVSEVTGATLAEVPRLVDAGHPSLKV